MQKDHLVGGDGGGVPGHTPGPWTAIQEVTAVGTPFALIVAASKGGKNDSVICHAPDYRDDRRSFEAFVTGNAALLSAAPELLEALELVRDYVVTMKGMGHEYQVAIDSAIAKATGAKP